MKTKILILMTVTTIFLTVQFLIIPVKGMTKSDVEDTLIILEGKVDSSYYEVSGYAIIQNNVVSDIVGEYEIVYQSLQDGMVYTRKVEVISRTDKEYFNMESCSINTFKNYPMTLEKSVSLSDNEQILLIRYITSVDNNKGHLYMYYIRNAEIIKEVQLFYNVEMKVNDVLVDGSEFVIIGQIWNSLYANYDIVFVICDKSGLRKCNMILGGSKTDEGITGFLVNDGYLVVGKTDSEDQIFEENKKENMFIMKISKKDYQISKITYNTSYPYINDIKLIKTTTGIFLLSPISIDQIELMQINEKGENLKSKKITIGDKTKIEDVYVNNDKIMLILTNAEKLEIGELSFKGYTKEYEKEETLELIDCNSNDEIISFIYQQDDGYKFVILKKDYEKIYEKDLFHKYLTSNNLELHEQAIIENLTDQGIINIHKFEYLKIITLGKNIVTKDTDYYHDYQIIMNGKKIEHTNTTNNINLSTFGNYHVNYYFNNDIDLLMEKNIKVSSLCSIKDGNIYDIGLKINHNGIGYLNNERIENGYQINESGSYTLEIIGQNGAKEVINFEVRDLTFKNDKIENNDLIINMNLENVEYTEDILKYNVSLNEENNFSQVNNLWEWMYTIPALLTLGIGFIIIKIKY